jgi:hypothetical protein
VFSGVEKRLKSAGQAGLFTTIRLAAGTVVIPQWHDGFYDGMEGWQVLDTHEILALPAREFQLFRRYGLDVDFTRIVGPLDEQYVTTLDNFVNHSCEPTMAYDTLGNVICARDLNIGEELTVDYGCFTVNFDEGYPCECASASCRGTVTCHDWRALSRKYGYAMPKFLHGRIRELKLTE